VTSVNWATYDSLHLGIEVPPIDTVFINRLGVPATGAGELAITLVAASLGNAIFDATGVRIRQVPLTAERVKSAMAKKS
jgi:CO/xanthine dehydrogenase Mo-binding subunit